MTETEVAKCRRVQKYVMNHAFLLQGQALAPSDGESFTQSVDKLTHAVKLFRLAEAIETLIREKSA